MKSTEELNLSLNQKIVELIQEFGQAHLVWKVKIILLLAVVFIKDAVVLLSGVLITIWVFSMLEITNSDPGITFKLLLAAGTTVLVTTFINFLFDTVKWPDAISIVVSEFVLCGILLFFLIIEKGITDFPQLLMAVFVIGSFAFPMVYVTSIGTRVIINRFRSVAELLLQRKALTEEIFIPLIYEDVPVWRPVKSIKQGDNLYLIPTNTFVPEGEYWEFQPGSYVSCIPRTFSDGETRLAASSDEEETLIAISTASPRRKGELH